jgi:hypothetical protein
MTAYTLKEYAAHLAAAGKQLDPAMKRTMTKAGLNIRDDWRKRATAKNPVHAKKYPSTIIMRRTIVVDGMLSVTVEPGSWGQGKLGMVLEYGTPWSAAQMSHMEALEAETPELLRWLAKAAADAVR